MRRSAVIAASLLALALVAGCDQGSNNDAGDGSGRSSSDSTSRPSSDSESGDGNKDSKSGGGSLESCIVGDWDADPDALDAIGIDTGFLDELGSEAELEFVFTFSKDGAFDWNWSFSSTGTMQGVPFSMDGYINMIGTWKASGSSKVDIALDDTNGSVTVSAAGQEHTEDMGADDLAMTGADDETMTVTCSGSTLTMTDHTGETLTLKRQ